MTRSSSAGALLKNCRSPRKEHSMQRTFFAVFFLSGQMNMKEFWRWAISTLNTRGPKFAWSFSLGPCRKTSAIPISLGLVREKLLRGEGGNEVHITIGCPLRPQYGVPFSWAHVSTGLVVRCGHPLIINSRYCTGSALGSHPSAPLRDSDVFQSR